MTDYPIRFFAEAAHVRRLGEAMLGRCLPKEEWTHEAHLATCLWLIDERLDFDCAADLPVAIASYNESVGGQNTDSAGYHETITQLYVIGIGLFARACPEEGLLARVNALLASPIAARDWPLRFYTAERLFSVEARGGWVEPDVNPILL
ncbi:MAG: hypothetical protein ACKOUT_13365 [Novosphingobium sp.]